MATETGPPATEPTGPAPEAPPDRAPITGAGAEVGAVATDGARPIRLVVLFGGRSAEHDISCVTARHVVAAADPARYRIDPVAITREGRWQRADDAARALAAGPDALPDALPTTGTPVEPLALARAGSGGAEGGGSGGTEGGDDGEQVVVLPLLHGPLGEDGTVQGLLELADVPYVGTGVLGSALAMDKAAAKEVLAANGIAQGRWRSLHEAEADAGALAAAAADLGFPIFVKPANMGSSIGVSKARDADELAAAVELALTYDDHVVLEEAIEGREIECAVLGSYASPRASVPGEVRPGADFYDFEDKYASGTAELVIPANLPDEVADELRAVACRAFRALRCEGMARVDFFYEADGRGLLVNEVNTIPGFTPISMYPRMWEATGLGYAELIDELVRLAVDRHARKRRRTDHG